jgi:molybdate transport system substrate-binding protein
MAMLRSVRHRSAAGAVAILAVSMLASCGGDDGDTAITVLAASSLSGTFTRLGQEFEAQHPGVSVKFAFDSSATLAQQATQGAPADVLATADTDTMNSATSAQASRPEAFATNVMVLASPASNPANIQSFSDLDKPSVKFVVCVPTAPCGKIGQALLEENHITGTPVSQEVDVKSVLAKLTEGEADAGIVYATDVVTAGHQVSSLPIPGSAKQVTTYPIVALEQSKHPDLAEQFVDLVTGSAGQQVLQDAGFGKP